MKFAEEAIRDRMAAAAEEDIARAVQAQRDAAMAKRLLEPKRLELVRAVPLLAQHIIAELAKLDFPNGEPPSNRFMLPRRRLFFQTRDRQNYTFWRLMEQVILRSDASLWHAVYEDIDVNDLEGEEEIADYAELLGYYPLQQDYHSLKEAFDGLQWFGLNILRRNTRIYVQREPLGMLIQLNKLQQASVTQ